MSSNTSRGGAGGASPGPWKACGATRGGCKCGQVWSIPRDLPIATVRLQEVPEEGMPPVPWEEFVANMDLIASAPDLRARLATAEARVATLEGEREAELRAAFLNETDQPWLRFAEVVIGHMPPYPQPTTKPSTVVRWGGWFLRHSAGPRQGHFWDVYGDDYMTRGLAYRALGEAPPPPPLVCLNRANPDDQDAIRDAMAAAKFTPTTLATPPMQEGDPR